MCIYKYTETNYVHNATAGAMANRKISRSVLGTIQEGVRQEACAGCAVISGTLGWHDMSR